MASGQDIEPLDLDGIPPEIRTKAGANAMDDDVARP